MAYPTDTLPIKRQRDVMDRERLAMNSLKRKAAKHKGRNHWRNWERRQMAEAKKRASAITNATKLSAAAKILDQTRDYWRGLHDEHP
jgi:hypothetical protein